MVLEDLELTPFVQWLFGPGWYDGALFQPLPLVVIVLLAGLGFALGVRAIRRGPVSTSRRTGAALGIAAWAGTVLLGLLAAAWHLIAGLLEADKKAGEAQETHERLREAVERLSDAMSWLLGADWQRGAIYEWFLLLLCLAATAFVVGWLIAAARRGPVAATVGCGQAVGDMASDLARISPRRVLALVRLAVQEAVRRRVLVVFLVFVVILLFADLFLDSSGRGRNRDPARIYLSTMLTTTSFLVLPLALFLGVHSLPRDLRNRTLHTIVTKPVRTSEIVLGRLLGFAVVGTGLLTVMGLVSYAFVIRGLSHTHTLTAEELKEGKTGKTQQHRHAVTVDSEGRVRVEIERGHWHDVSAEGSGPDAVYTLGSSPRGSLQARVPVYGTLRFKDDAGRDSDKGINVGHEWTYRTFIKGGTQAAAIWTFDGVTEDLFPKGIPLEMTLEIYRTYKGDVEKGILGSLALRNPKTGRKALLRNFYAKEFREPDVQFVPRTWMAVEYGKSSKPQSVDLFRDLVADGKVEVWIQCITPAQCFGMAKADVYLRARSAPFWLNFAKGYAGIWLQMVVVLGLAVMFSTFLSEPVALVAAGGMLVAGLVRGFMLQVAMHQIEGGGPFESFIRMVLQLSVTAEMEQNLLTHVAQMLDRLLEAGLRMLVAVVPTIGDFSFDEFVATGFDVNGDWLLQCVSRALAYALAMFLAGYLFLKTREVAR